jgi:hypothetical protein
MLGRGNAGNAISNEILTRMLDGKTLSEVRVGVEKGDFSYQFV